ncbi:NAD(P)/FAD-dependent oxidoreductase [Bordetella sp. BOR01]|uniref:phytoene desaturase family protein n=1 Tax=Bordetella sp. BOR01 TaxID=2854779 RepID=UPI001C48E2E3|nr:NAD(P)/FAD-dependent oxidoreductase [Bordetella sp. BOR01]MBV7485314.1 NAD(P)/FAD-dependent oxidoreductase [Bordetella sp. BOR01]
MNAEKYDAVIIGGGHNGLVCGAYLARAGRRVCVLERRDLIGGAAVSEAVWPGYRVSTASYTMALLQPRIMLDLELARHGLEVVPPPPMIHLFEPGKYLVLDGDDSVARQLARYSEEDARAYPAYRAHMAALGAIVSRLLWEIPPDPAATSLSARLALLRFAWRYRGLGDRLHDIYEVLTLSAADFLRRWFRSDEALCALGFYVGCGGATTTLSAPGSAYVLLRGYIRDHTTEAGPAGFIRGGMGSISEAIARAGQEHGMVIRTQAPVRRVVLSKGRACGVELENGEQIQAGAVISNAPAKLLFRKLVPQDALPAAFLARVDAIRDHSHAFKVHIALSRLPRFAGLNAGDVAGGYPVQARLAASTDVLEQAYDDAKYGRIAAQPALVVLTPSVVDATVAPEGRHLMTIFGQHAPYRLRGRNWDEHARNELREAVLRTLERHAPDIRDCIEHIQVLGPADIEARFSLPGGHVHHGELSADQIFFRRPVPGAADYRTPVAGLYQCGASVHPGGGVTGVPGYNAARVILLGK